MLGGILLNWSFLGFVKPLRIRYPHLLVGQNNVYLELLIFQIFNPILHYLIIPLMFFLHDSEMPQAIKLKLSDLKDT